MDPRAEKSIWFLFSIFVSITQFSNFWVMSYGGVFSFQNSVFNGIFVIKHTLRDPLVLSSQIYLLSPTGHSFFFLYLFFFLFFFRAKSHPRRPIRRTTHTLTHADLSLFVLHRSLFDKRFRIWLDLALSSIQKKKKKKGRIYEMIVFVFVVNSALWWACLWSYWAEMWKEENWVLVLWLV